MYFVMEKSPKKIKVMQRDLFEEDNISIKEDNLIASR